MQKTAFTKNLTMAENAKSHGLTRYDTKSLNHAAFDQVNRFGIAPSL